MTHKCKSANMLKYRSVCLLLYTCLCGLYIRIYISPWIISKHIWNPPQNICWFCFSISIKVLWLPFDLFFFLRGMAAVNMIHHMSLYTSRSVKSPLVIRMLSITWILKCTHQHTLISLSHLKLFHVILTMEGRFGKFVQLGSVLRLALPWKGTRFSPW